MVRTDPEGYGVEKIWQWSVRQREREKLPRRVREAAMGKGLTVALGWGVAVALAGHSGGSCGGLVARLKKGMIWAQVELN
ncbi:hypothetical protein Acr_15g0002740 [Actinidia rufa]|uniref:Uncharacterized protein n=1 Tax=Actinidia rufa TaxID=165716 RepID=A0A7J0FSK3_9ERIC|nr:hypothetical protein Acr_15g0002740 [Actinidia rufa]